MLLSGSGLRLYGAYRNLTGAFEQFSLGRDTEAVIDLGGFAAEWVGEGAEQGAARLGLFLRRSMTRVSASTLAFGQLLARGAGVIGTRGGFGRLPAFLFNPGRRYACYGFIGSHRDRTS